MKVFPDSLFLLFYRNTLKTGTKEFIFAKATFLNHRVYVKALSVFVKIVVNTNLQTYFNSYSRFIFKFNFQVKDLSTAKITQNAFLL